MAIQNATRDDNRVTSLIGVDSTLFTSPTTAAVDPSTHELLVKASLTSDVEIGAVEIKNSTDDTRATVTTKGLSVFDAVANSLAPAVYDYISLSYTGSNLTGVVYKTGGSGGTTISTLTLGYDGSNNLTSVTKT